MRMNHLGIVLSLLGLKPNNPLPTHLNPSSFSQSLIPHISLKTTHERNPRKHGEEDQEGNQGRRNQEVFFLSLSLSTLTLSLPLY